MTVFVVVVFAGFATGVPRADVDILCNHAASGLRLDQARSPHQPTADGKHVVPIRCSVVSALPLLPLRGQRIRNRGVRLHRRRSGNRLTVAVHAPLVVAGHGMGSHQTRADLQGHSCHALDNLRHRPLHPLHLDESKAPFLNPVSRTCLTFVKVGGQAN